MTRQEAAQFCRDELNKHELKDWGVRLNQDAKGHFLGMCSYRDKVIILNAHHIDIHPTPDVINTIRHEVAHALCPGHAHDSVWADKATEIGCDNTSPCSNLSLSPEVIDAIRSGATVEVTFTEQVIRTPKYNITRLQDKCEYCGKVAKSVKETTVVKAGDTEPDLKFITLECGHMLIKKIPKGTPFHLFQMGGSLECKHVWDKNSCLLCDRKRPYQFQLDGMKFGEAALAVNNGVAFFDEMGLGKTVEMGGILKYHSELYPVLHVVKSALKYQTAMFLMKWLGPEHAPWIIESSTDMLPKGLKHYIISYDMLVPKSMQRNGKTVKMGFDIKKFDDIGIKCVVLDECQQIKNVDSSRTQMVRKVIKNQNRKVIAMSGTPWNNKGSELFPILNMLDPIKFYSEERFKSQWVDYYWQGAFRKEGGIRRIEEFKEHIKDICIRRERTEVMSELPLVNRTKLYVKMDADTEATYDAAVDDFVKWYQEEAANATSMHILAAMNKMRHLVALAKIPATLDYVDEFVEDTDRKIVIFAHHIDVQKMLFDELNERYGDQMPVIAFTAGQSSEDIHYIQKKFNESKRAIMVASTLAAGEGLNLQTCCDCLMHERQWNPGKEEQAEGRFIRIGSVATSVNAIYAHLEGLTTIDPQLDGIIERKRLQFHNVHNKGEVARWSQDSIAKELADSIVSGHLLKKNRKKAS